MSEPTFQAFSPEHLIAIFLTVALPFALAAVARAAKSALAEHAVVGALSAILFANYAGYLLFVRGLGELEWQQMLPLQMCDWAMAVVIVALWTKNHRWFEVAYFWGIGGTLQAVLTPNLRFGFPDLRFVSFFISHGGIIVAVGFLMLTRGLRPYPFSIVRAFVWSELYFLVTLLADHLTGVNYGFLLHKPEAFSLLSFLSDDRPLYLLQMHGLALVFFAVLYLPFALYDSIRQARL